MVLMLAVSALAAEKSAVKTASASDAKAMRVSGIVPLPGELLEDRIVVFFDEDLSTKILAPSASTPPMTIEPESPPSSGRALQRAPLPTPPRAPLPTPARAPLPSPGSFRVERNYISYQMESPRRNQVYKVTINPTVVSKSGRAVRASDRTFVVSSIPFTPLMLWPISEGTTGTVLGLSFPAAVKLADLKARLSVTSDKGAIVPFGLEAQTGSRVFRITLDGDQDWPVQVDVGLPLTDATGRLPMANSRRFTYPRVAELQVTALRWGQFTADRQEIEMVFSWPVKSEDLQRHLSIKDTNGKDVPCTCPVRGESRQQIVRIQLEKPENAKVQVNLAKGLSSGRKVYLRGDYTQPIVGRPFAAKRETVEPLRFENSNASQEGKQGFLFRFELSHPVRLSDLREHIRFEPALPNLQIEPLGGGEFNVRGDWRSKTKYEVTLTPGLKYGDGLTLTSDLVRRFEVDQLPPYLAFDYEGKYYFPKRTGLPLSLLSRNLRQAEVRLHRMFPSNLVVALDDIGEKGEGNPRFVTTWSEEIAKTTMTLTTERDRMLKLPLKMETLFPADRRGVFCLEAKPMILDEDEEAEEEGHRYERRQATDRKIVLVTDIGVLAHWQDRELVLFAHDLYSLAPLPGAKVTVYSMKNQLLGQSNTDAQGIARLAQFNPALGAPKAAVVEFKDDYTFLDLQARREDAEEFEPEAPRYDRAAYDAFLYADRELYRPSETVHLHWIVRRNYGEALSNVPLMLRIVKPNGADLLTRPVMLSALGSGGLDLTTELIYPTGKYQVQLEVPGSKRPIGAYTFNLEDFVPNRIKAAIQAKDDRWVAGRSYPITVNAQHLFGAPASGRKTSLEVLLERQALRTKNWKEYRFDNDSSYAPDPVQLGEEQTDENGVTTFTFAYAAPAQATFPMKATAVARVFELGGRPVIAKAERALLPSDLCLGLMLAPGAGRRAVEVYAAAINADETPAKLDKVKVTLERQVWNYYVRRYYGYHEPNWAESFEPIETREAAVVDGKAYTSFTTISNYGYYRVKVHSEKTPQYSTVSFYSWGSGYQIADTARPSLIKVTLDKASYAIGEEAVVRVESPFDGKGIVVVQGDELQQMVPVEIRDKVGLARIRVTAAMFPNVWIETTVIHAVQKGKAQVYPFSSFAATSLRVTDARRQLQIAFPGLPPEMRPAQDAHFSVETRNSAGLPVEAELTLAAVDEGIHLITGYKNPDPIGWLLRLRKPDERRAHYYDKVAYDFEKAPIGGDGGEEMEQRVNVPGKTWIRPVALWSGVVRTGKDGRTTVTMAVPEFTGQLRLVAVACTTESLGAQSGSLFVRRPFMMETSMPRFLLPGDSARCSAVLYNHTDAPCKAKLTWSYGGELRASSGSKELEIRAHGEQAFAPEFLAGLSVGQGEIRWEAVFTDAAGRELERLRETAPIPVRAPAAYQTIHEIKALKPGETVTFRNTKMLDDDRATLEVSVGVSPLLRLEKALQYVIGYPYGCVEQTTSRLLPMYLLRKNAVVVKSAIEEPAQIDPFIRAGISRLFSMQTSFGGLSFWPGYDEVADYGSIYALHFLTLVKTGREFELPMDNFKALQEYVRGIAMNSDETSDPALYRRAYAIYVLALDGDLAALQQIERLDNMEIPRSARYLLAAALALNTKDPERVKQCLAKPSHPYEEREMGETFNSPIRNTAVELFMLRQMGGDPAQIAERANRLVSFLETQHYGTTQETAFAITALVGYLTDIRGNVLEASAKITGPKEEKTISRDETYRAKHKGKGGAFTVANTGKTEVLVNVTMSGVPEKPNTAAFRKGVAVERAFHTSLGEQVKGDAFAHTGSFIVALQIECEADVENLIVADLLPAGFEVENPRLNPDAVPSMKLGRADAPTHLELRDDRLVLAFDSLARGKHRFYYIVNAVTPGQYQYPAVTAECMYDPSVAGASAAGTIEVK
jgi:hypothetical protein